jgi:hypothetical protein
MTHDPYKEANDWNDKYDVGQKVIVKMDDGSEKTTITKYQATVMGGHTAVGWFEGIRGGYLLKRARTIEFEERKGNKMTNHDFGKKLEKYHAIIKGKAVEHCQIANKLYSQRKGSQDEVAIREAIHHSALKEGFVVASLEFKMVFREEMKILIACEFSGIVREAFRVC